MSRDLERRLEALEESSGLLIASLCDYAKWNYNGRDPSARWDAKFKQQIEEFARKNETVL